MKMMFCEKIHSYLFFYILCEGNIIFNNNEQFTKLLYKRKAFEGSGDSDLLKIYRLLHCYLPFVSVLIYCFSKYRDESLGEVT